MNNNVNLQKNGNKSHIRIIAIFLKYMEYPCITIWGFLMINIIVFLNREISKTDMEKYRQFIDAAERMVNQFIGHIGNTLMYTVLNLSTMVMSTLFIFYWIVKLVRWFYRWYRINKKRLYAFHGILIFACVVYMAVLSVDFDSTMDMTYRFLRWTKNIIKAIIGYGDVDNIPTAFWGINLLIRTCLLCGILYFITKSKAIWRYLFIDRIKVENDKVIPADPKDKNSTSRFMRFIYDEQRNRLNRHNIIVLGSIIMTVVIFAISVYSQHSDNDILEKCWEMVKRILQWSTVNESPFADPVPAAKLINIVFRIFTFLIYVVCGVISASTIVMVIKALEGKSVKKQLKVTGVASGGAAGAIVFIYLVSNSTDISQSAKLITIKTLLAVALIVMILIGVVYIWNGII